MKKTIVALVAITTSIFTVVAVTAAVFAVVTVTAAIVAVRRAIRNIFPVPHVPCHKYD